MIIDKLRRLKSRKSETANLLALLANIYGFVPDKKNGINIDILAQEGDTLPKSSTFIRLISPLAHPFVSDKISLNICKDISKLRTDTQIIIIQRAVLSSEQEAKNLVLLAKNRGIKLIVDTDDAFFSLDKDHPNYKELHHRHDALMYLIKNANQLWVSTDNLKKYYQKTCETQVYVIPNTLDPRIWNKKNIVDIPNKSILKLLYMGTATHGRDFQMIVPWLDKLYKKYPGSFELHIVGVTSNLPKKPWLKPIQREPSTVIYPNFVKWIQSKGPFDIGLAPLVDSEFNKYKSDIKCLDYLAVGAIPMVSDVNPYSTKSLDSFIIRNTNNEDAWIKPLEKILLDMPGFKKKHLQILEQGQGYIWEKRSSGVAAKYIAELLKIN